MSRVLVGVPELDVDALAVVVALVLFEGLVLCYHVLIERPRYNRRKAGR